MSLSQKDLSAIQKAGQAAHNASETIALSVRAQGEALVENLASQPFASGSEQVIERFKSLSNLSQGLIAVESQLQKLYALANELASPAADVIVLQPVTKRRSIANAAAVDVMAKAAKVAKKMKATKKVGRKAGIPGALTANDSKLLSYLQGVLNADAGTVVTGAEMAAGAKLPLGSVGISQKRLIATGAIKMVDRGTYQLGDSPANSATEAQPAKKEKAVAKKVKTAKALNKAVKSKVTRKAKAAPKKSKVTELDTVAPVVEVATAPI